MTNDIENIVHTRLQMKKREIPMIFIKGININSFQNT